MVLDVILVFLGVVLVVLEEGRELIRSCSMGVGLLLKDPPFKGPSF